ncbi:MAG: amidophosphoribosyltransferase [Gammaproteobacteria bacterium]|nr:amidophosphoribosyltransferase [Gammaproteobacteria bacterium]
MCGLVGIVANHPVNQEIYDALTVLQHRGQDSSGIMTDDNGVLCLRKSNGLVSDVFSQEDMATLRGNIGIGHVRYPTAGSLSSTEAQPFYVNTPFGISLAHNGNLVNTNELRDHLKKVDKRHLNTESDTEALLNLFAHEVQIQNLEEVTPQSIFDATEKVFNRCSGGYAVVAMILNHGLIAFRDPNAIRPLVIGVRESNEGKEYMVASESVALDVVGFSLLRDVLPGEAIFIDTGGNFYSKQCVEPKSYTPCIFEFVYFARPDSIIDGMSVYKSRLKMGEYLAQSIIEKGLHHEVDVVIPIPDTSRTSALQVAHHLGVKYREGFIKNRYIGRTFIMPGQDKRKKSVRQKLNPIELELKDKNVLLIDDSIVRGTTSKRIIEMTRSTGAKKVFFASAAPPVKYPNVYGIDMPASSELIASGKSEEELAGFIGADWLIYQTLDDLIEAVKFDETGVQAFDTSCFSGEYVTNDISQKYLKSLESKRSDDAIRESEQLRKQIEINDPSISAN